MKRLMAWMRDFFGMLYSPSLQAKIVLGVIPFVVLGLVYQSAMLDRKAEKPDDRMLPSVNQMYDEVAKYVVDRDMRTKQLTFLTDALSSLKRVCYGVVIGSALALVVGLLAGVFPWFRAMIMPIVIFFSTIIPVSVLAMLMLVFGTDEIFKIALVCFGITFLMIRDASATVQSLPAEQKIKMLTLGGKSLSYIFYIVIPQILPRFIETVSLYLGPAWGYVLVAEMMKADSGLAYRILLVKRSMNMPLIIPIVLLITAIAYVLYLGLRLLNKAAFPWYFEVKR